MRSVVILVILLAEFSLASLLKNIALKNTPEDAKLNFTALAAKYVHGLKEYSVVTEDGYILGLFRIPGDKNRPVLIVHGVIDSSDSYILRGEHSMVAILAKAGFDVWILNWRGNRYSQGHVVLNPDEDKDYWQFSAHEIGYYDVPAAIDFVLDKTCQDALITIGHSEGTTAHFIMASTRPEYNSKVKIFIALAPVAFLNHPSPLIDALAKASPVLNGILINLGMEKLFGDDSSVNTVIEIVCSQELLNYKICMDLGFFQLFGEDSEEFEPEFVPTIFGHIPTSTSRKNLLHYTQIALRKRFAHYDFGLPKNLEVYGSVCPPDYDLSKITMKVAMFVAENDLITGLEDIEILMSRLPNVVLYHKMERKKWNHVGYTLGRSAHKTLYPMILDILNKY